MNSENFHEYLKNPSMLYQISYQELKSLALQYPYSPNLRYLLMVKSLLDGSKDYDRNLALASLYSLDRKKLYQQVKSQGRLKEIHENYHLAEDFLELKDINTLEEVLENQPVVTAEPSLAQHAGEPFNMEALVPPGEQDQRSFFREEEEEGLDFLEDLLSDGEPLKEEATPAEEFANAGFPAENQGLEEAGLEAETSPTLEDLLTESSLEAKEKLSPPIEIFDEIRASTPDPAVLQAKDIPFEITNDQPAPRPVPKSAFNSWQQQMTPQPDLLGSNLPSFHLAKSKPAPAIEPAPGDNAKNLAARSVSEDAGVASETLAALLEGQGHFDKAIRMYERLSLQHPEKSSFFAAKIEKLKSNK